MAWSSLSFAFGSILTSSKMTNLYDNITAQANGDTGAPKQQTAGIADLAVTEAKLAASAVSQSKLKSTTTTQSSPFTGNGTITPTGGNYTIFMLPYTLSTDKPDPSYNTSTAVGYSVATGTGTGYLASRYMQASPPYDLGDGEVPLFVFALVDNATDKILGVSVAEDPPWAYHGPTNIQADYHDEKGRAWRGTGKGRIQITQEIKQADMKLIPHPWVLDQQPENSRVVLLNPFDPRISQLGVNTAATLHGLHDGAIELGNVVTGARTPSGVQLVDWEIKTPLSKGGIIL